MVRGNRRCQIIKHATHLHIAFQIVKRYLFLGTARHTIRATGREVASRREFSGAWHCSLNRFEAFLLPDLSACKFGHGTQQPFGVRMLRPGKQFFNGRLLHNSPGIHHRDPISDFGHYAQVPDSIGKEIVAKVRGE